MAAKIFAIKNKSTGEVERLIKAETRSQVNKYLVASIEIESIGAVDVADLLSNKQLRIDDATATQVDNVEQGDTNEGTSSVESGKTEEGAGESVQTGDTLEQSTSTQDE